jgi:hypothetical protein
MKKSIYIPKGGKIKLNYATEPWFHIISPSLFCPMDNQGELSLEIHLTFFYTRIFTIEYPGISFIPDALLAIS